MITLYESILDDEETILGHGDLTALALLWKERLSKTDLLKSNILSTPPTIIPISEDKFALKYDKEHMFKCYWRFTDKETVDLVKNHCEYIEIPNTNKLEITTRVDLDFENLIKFKCNDSPVFFETITLIVSGEAKLSNINPDIIHLKERGEFKILGPNTPTISLKNLSWGGRYHLSLVDLNIHETENVTLVEHSDYSHLQYKFLRCYPLSDKVDDSMIYHMLGLIMEYWDFQYSKGVVTIEPTGGYSINSCVPWERYGVKKIYAKEQRILKWISQQYLKLLEADKIDNLYIDSGAKRNFDFDTYKRKPLIKRYVITCSIEKGMRFKAWCDTSEDKDITWNQYKSGRTQNKPAVSTLCINAWKFKELLTNCHSNCALLEIEPMLMGKLFKDKIDKAEDKNKIPQSLFDEYINFDNFPNLKYIVLVGYTDSLKRVDNKHWGLFE